MPSNNTAYEHIQNKIQSLKDSYAALRDKPDHYVFSAVCIKAHLYKNPALILRETDFNDMIVDSTGDGGADILLTDPNSENSDLIIAQAKYYTNISKEDVNNALNKMLAFYKNMKEGHYEQVSEKVQRRFLSLDAEQADDAKVKFILYTSALKNRIQQQQIIQQFRNQLEDANHFDVEILFGKDIEEEIKESESRRPTVEYGKLKIDQANNRLRYGTKAEIVNVSAFSLKELYARYSIQLLAKNLRYHIPGREIDRGINNTIQNEPQSFWMKNNGITIICDEFEIDGREVKLKNFSVINGGQTTYMIHKSSQIDAEHDFFLQCKIICNEGTTEDEKNAFSLAIAKATNTQKPIKQVDLKANAPEQIRFSQAMREVDIFYQTKRGEEVPSRYREAYSYTSLLPIGKLVLAAVFQMPCTSRTKPSTIYQAEYYDKIFDDNQKQMAQLSKELIYIDYYFRNAFLKKFDRENKCSAVENDYISFAHNARTVCIAFVALASRYYQQNITDEKMRIVFDELRHEGNSERRIYNVFADLGELKYLFPTEVFQNKDQYEELLSELFELMIDVGSNYFFAAKDNDNALTPANFLKKDSNYYKILSTNWGKVSREIKKVLKTVMN